MIIVGAAIKRIRESSGYSQSQFAKRVGTSQSTVAEYEKNIKVPSFSVFTNIVKLAYEKKIPINLSDFVPREEKKKRKEKR